MVSPLNLKSASPPISVGTLPAANKRTETEKIIISLIVTSSSSHNQENPELPRTYIYTHLKLSRYALHNNQTVLSIYKF